MRYLMLPGGSPGLGGVTCMVLDTRPAPENPGDHPAYPYGMVQVRLPDSVEWGCREPWFGPEDLACLEIIERDLNL